MNETQASDATKVCPYCAETIKAAAIKCRYCHSDLSATSSGGPTPPQQPQTTATNEQVPLQPRDWWTYVALHLPATVTEVAAFASAEKTTIARHVDNLVRRGLVHAVSGADEEEPSYVCSRQAPPGAPVPPDLLPENYTDLEPLDWWLYVLLEEPLTGAELDERTGLPPSTTTSHLSKLRRAQLVSGVNLPGKYAYRREGEFDAGGMTAIVHQARLYPFSAVPAGAAKAPGAPPPLPEPLADMLPMTLWFYLALEEPSSNIELGQLLGFNDEAVMANLAQLMAAGLVHYSLVPGASHGLTFYRTRTFDAAAMAAIEQRARRSGLPSPRERRQYLATHAAPAQQVEPPGRTADATPDGTAVPVADWRGLVHMTHDDWVAVRCDRCDHVYRVEGEVANTVADQQSLGRRLSRWGTRTEQLGATFTLGASGRRIAAGNEHQRQQQQLGIALGLVACPQCASTDVTLFKV